jgi:hypothetical protein
MERVAARRTNSKGHAHTNPINALAQGQFGSRGVRDLWGQGSWHVPVDVYMGRIKLSWCNHGIRQQHNHIGAISSLIDVANCLWELYEGMMPLMLDFRIFWPAVHHPTLFRSTFADLHGMVLWWCLLMVVLYIYITFHVFFLHILVVKKAGSIQTLRNPSWTSSLVADSYGFKELLFNTVRKNYHKAQVDSSIVSQLTQNLQEKQW